MAAVSTRTRHRAGLALSSELVNRRHQTRRTSKLQLVHNVNRCGRTPIATVLSNPSTGSNRLCRLTIRSSSPIWVFSVGHNSRAYRSRIVLALSSQSTSHVQVLSNPSILSVRECSNRTHHEQERNNQLTHRVQVCSAQSIRRRDRSVP